MIILLATDGKYAKGNDFPMFTIPLKMEGATSQSLEDFQWWAYSSDLKKWLDKNPKEWVADSEEIPNYGDISEIIRESQGGSGYSMQKALSESNEYNPEGRVSKFADFISDAVFEDDSKNKAEEEKVVKFHFAYNKLESEGKLEKEYVVKNQAPGKPKAVFLCMEDQESGANLDLTLDAYKVSQMEINNNGAKFRLFEISDSKLGGKIGEDQTGPGLAQKVMKNSILIGAYAVAGAGIYAAAKWIGGAYLLRSTFRGLQSIVGKAAVKSTKGLSMMATLAKAGNGIKFLGRAINPMKAISFWANAGKIGKYAVQGAKFQGYLANIRGAGVVAKSLGMVKGFVTGAKVASGFAKTAELFNPVGWALLAIGAIGSTWNWFQGNQAPRFGNVEDFAKGSFDPKSIKVGVPITICWSQPAGGWGIIVSFLFNNETRTTMELVKVADNGGESIFILTQINAKEIQKQIAEYDMTLISFDNGEVTERGYFDNEDMDFKMLSVKKDLNALFNYQGSCDWDLFETEFDNSSGTLLISDPNAPDEYEFHFSDSEDNIINVIGKKVSTDELSKYSSDDLNRLFGITASKEKKETDSKIKKAEENPVNAGVNDSLKTPKFSNLLESSIITKFSDFKKAEYTIMEDDNNASVNGNPAEGSDDVDSKGSKMVELTAKQKSSPEEVAVYIVTERDYADPKLRGKYETGEFTNFLLDSDDMKAKNDSPINVDPNTDEILEDSKRGLYTYVEKKEEVKDVVKDEVQDADGSKVKGKEKETEIKDDGYYIKTNANDIKLKSRKNSTVVRDAQLSGGVNLFDTILTPRDKETLKIENWKTITFAKEVFDNRGDATAVKFRNKYAPFGDKSRKYSATDGEAFELAKRFVEQTKDRIKYE